MVIALLILQLFRPFAIPNDTQVVLNGNWQSCREDDGFAERIYPYLVNGAFKWEFHFGPYHEFGLYVAEQPDEHDHRDELNLLAPNYTAETGRNMERDVPSLKLHVSVHAGGGSRDDCESYYVTVRKQ